MENMDKGLTVQKWVLINRPKIPRMPKHLSAQFVSLSPKVWYFDEKRLHRASLVRDTVNVLWCARLVGWSLLTLMVFSHDNLPFDSILGLVFQTSSEMHSGQF